MAGNRGVQGRQTHDVEWPSQFARQQHYAAEKQLFLKLSVSKNFIVMFTGSRFNNIQVWEMSK